MSDHKQHHLHQHKRQIFLITKQKQSIVQTEYILWRERRGKQKNKLSNPRRLNIQYVKHAQKISRDTWPCNYTAYRSQNIPGNIWSSELDDPKHQGLQLCQTHWSTSTTNETRKRAKRKMNPETDIKKQYLCQCFHMNRQLGMVLLVNDPNYPSLLCCSKTWSSQVKYNSVMRDEIQNSP